MKKIYFLIIALLAINTTMAQGCLPEGITFETQEQIDNFQTDYPGCTEIEGDVFINGYDDITNLEGLNSVTLIGGGLIINSNFELISLSGIENLTSVGGSISIWGNQALESIVGLASLNSIGGGFEIYGNDELASLEGLSNLTSITGMLSIQHNLNLTDITAIENLSSNSITDLYIHDNNSLSACQAQSICNYLSEPNGSINIYNNSSGCNSPNEVANNCGVTLTCLPHGNYYFLSQTDIDNFQSIYPDCSEINGNIWIEGEDIYSLIGLDIITEISGNLIIGHYYGNPNLTSLIGLDSLEFIGKDFNIINCLVLNNISNLGKLITVGGMLSIGNCSSLISFDGLENLTSINGDIWIQQNQELTNIEALSNVTSINGSYWIDGNSKLASLYGLNNIETATIINIFIRDNPMLSYCDVQSICDYLENPNGLVGIYDNASGCNSREEVETACLVGIQNIIQENKLSIYPNPSSSLFTIQFSLENEEQVKLLVLNNLGQVVATLANETLSEGQHELNWNAEGMPAGVYFYNVQIGKQAGTGKLVLMK